MDVLGHFPCGRWFEFIRNGNYCERGLHFYEGTDYFWLSELKTTFIKAMSNILNRDFVILENEYASLNVDEKIF